MKLESKIMEFGSIEQLQSIELRRNVLRKPLNLDFTNEELKLENNQIHVGCFYQNELVGVLILVKVSDKFLKMRQVAVKEDHQYKGIGKNMVAFSEQWANENNFNCIQLHARENAVSFYLSMNYVVINKMFLEVGIPHFAMEKNI